ncbi:hypothetical protein C1M55_28090 [Rhodococcus qingshengii]|uniref:hypothetical protein n=1 Tax=Rhodococcus qingshengii TaxID=334542 RepID=UPI000C9F18A4|nr:hypothetical protein [Rhodococcus qingshengii]AUS34593.1 hypothetical protein C1M55_28090 [Rhodococcus qingshengii]
MVKLAPYAKAVSAGVGEAVTVGTVTVSLLSLAPPNLKPVAVALSSLVFVLGILKTFHVWLVKNEPVIESAAAAVDELIPEIEESIGKHERLSVEPIGGTSPTTATVATPSQGAGFIPGPFSQSTVSAVQSAITAATGVVSDAERAGAEAAAKWRG